MEHLKEISEVVYLKMSYEEMENRIGNVVDRGVALKPGFTLRDLYNERVPYYEKYADTVSYTHLDVYKRQEQTNGIYF